MNGVVIKSVSTVVAQMEAANIWARATEERDAVDVPSDPVAKLPGIQQRLASPGATLHVAYRGHDSEGFALLLPHGPELELVYLAVDPAAWGRQTASALLTYVSSYAVEYGFDAVDLWVLADNERAIEIYRRAGWRSSSNLKDDGYGNSCERRMLLTLCPHGLAHSCTRSSQA